MTALNQYERLEATGIWRETPQSRRRDVIVSFGEATLVLTDPRSELPLAHWSLPAITRTNPGQIPAFYSPGSPGGDELLEIDDELMISAMEKVHRAIESSRPHPGRLRHSITMSAIIAMIIAGIFWLPPALVRHAAKISPPAQKTQIGRIVMAETTLITGTPCGRPGALPALELFAERLLGSNQRIVVVPTTLRGAVHLPGPLTLIGNDLIAGQQSPEVAAGYILAAYAVARESDPLLDALRFAGPSATFHLLTAGKLNQSSLDGYGARVLARSSLQPADETLLKLFDEAQVSSEPYARSLDPTGEATLGLIEADPYRTALPRPILDDHSWIALQQICDE